MSDFYTQATMEFFVLIIRHYYFFTSVVSILIGLMYYQNIKTGIE